MKKVLSVLVATLFAASFAFAADPVVPQVQKQVVVAKVKKDTKKHHATKKASSKKKVVAAKKK